MPLGVAREADYVQHTARLDDVALIVCYTDGLTEADRDPLQGEAAIERLLASEESVFAANPARYVSRLVSGKETHDDMAILTVRFGATQGRWAFDVGDSAAAYAIKQDFASRCEPRTARRPTPTPAR